MAKIFLDKFFVFMAVWQAVFFSKMLEWLSFLFVDKLDFLIDIMRFTSAFLGVLIGALHIYYSIKKNGNNGEL